MNTTLILKQILTIVSSPFLKFTYGEYGVVFHFRSKEVFSDLKDYIDQQRSKGVKVIGYGAAAKGMTVINAGKIQLDYIVDDNPLKQGLLCPGSNIPVYGSDVLADEKDNVVIVPLAWNFFDEIKTKAITVVVHSVETFLGMILTSFIFLDTIKFSFERLERV